MKKTIRYTISLLFAMVTVVSALTGSAFAKSDKSAKSSKSDKETSSAVFSGFASITPAQAREIALGHAGVEAADAVFTREKLDKAVYELKFSASAAKYEYEISAADGSILSCEMEAKEPYGAPDSSVSNHRPSIEAAVSPEQAHQIALNAAGLSAEGLKYVVCYVSWADHAPYAYEVKFSTRTAYYHYTIDLDSGAVLESVCSPRR